MKFIQKRLSKRLTVDFHTNSHVSKNMRKKTNNFGEQNFQRNIARVMHTSHSRNEMRFKFTRNERMK